MISFRHVYIHESITTIKRTYLSVTSKVSSSLLIPLPNHPQATMVTLYFLEIYINQIIHYVLVLVWFLAKGIIILSFTYVIVWIITHSVYCSVVFYCMDIQHLLIHYSVPAFVDIIVHVWIYASISQVKPWRGRSRFYRCFKETTKLFSKGITLFCILAV